MKFSQLRVVYEKARPFLPWLSLAWGIASAFFMTRNVSNTSRFLTVGSLLLVFLLVLPFLSLRMQSNAAEGLVQTKGRAMVGLYAAVSLLGQSAAQYILFFVLPFLYLAKNWLACAVTVALCASTLWDPWWNKLIRSSLYNAFLRLWATSLLVSMLFATVLSSWLGGFFVALAAAQLIVSLFWLVIRLDRSLVVRSLGVVASIAFPLATFWQMKQKTNVPFPLVGVWLRNQAFTLGKPDFQSREKILNVATELAARDLLPESDSAPRAEICCVTPLVAARSFAAPLTHVWSVNGKQIDAIDLPEAVGNGEALAFRTFSCKRNFAPLQPADVLSCAVYAAGVKISGVRLELTRVYPDMAY